MTRADSSYGWQQKIHRVIDVSHTPIPLIIVVSALPTVVLLIISYFQSITYARANLEGIVKTATTETEALLEDAASLLHRDKIDLQGADAQTAVKILQRQVYSDFRFREAGIINTKGLLTLTSFGVVDPPIPVSLTKTRFDPNNPSLQILGPGRTRIMQERSVVFVLKGAGQISGIYLLVDPVIFTYFLEVIPNLDLGSDGFIAFMTNDQHLLVATGTSPQDIFSSLNNSASKRLQVTRTTKDGEITVVAEVSRRWALRYWFREVIISAPITILISGLLSYLFINQVRQFSTLDYKLKQGLAQREFEVHYQPIIELKTGHCIGSEALLRWRHPQRGLIYPGLFIPIAEQTGFIIPMTEWLIEQVVQDQAALAIRFPGLYTSVNLSPNQLNTGNVDRLIQTLSRANYQSSVNHQPKVRITFEITENQLIEENGQVVQDAIARLKLWGACFAIDDFGTGYSNIGHLQKLDVDQLKLDQLFVKGLGHDNNMTHIVDGLIDLSNRIGLTMIAEGIETEAQYRYLKDRGIPYGQGWLFSRPLPIKDFEQFLQVNMAEIS